MWRHLTRRGLSAINIPLLASAALLLAPLGAPAAPSAVADPPSICGTTGPAKLLCGVTNPEDVFVVPGTQWVLTSSLASPGGLYIINARDKRPIALYPTATPRERFDRTTYDTCKGPPDAAEKERFSTLGVYVGAQKNGVYPVYATRYPGVGSVQVFELELRDTPVLTWVGCVPAPENMIVNAVVPLPDGGLLASKFYESGPNQAASRAKAEAGEVSGEVWAWHTGKGWEKVPGSDSSGTNGIEISRDGKQLFVSQWGSRTVMRLSLGEATPRRDTITLPFRPDNMHWAPDGSLIIGGHTDTTGAVVKVDPATLRVTELINRVDTPDFIHFSSAIEVGGEIWVGSSRSPRIAIYTLPLPASARTAP